MQTKLAGVCHFVRHDKVTYNSTQFWKDGLHLSENGYKEFSRMFNQLSMKNLSHSLLYKCNSARNEFKFQNDDFPALEKRNDGNSALQISELSCF